MVDQVTLTSNGGAGLALTDCSNVTISNITTSGNTWGGVALFTKGVAFTGGSNNITLSGTNSFGEINKLYIEVANGYQVTNFNQTDFGYVVPMGPRCPLTPSTRRPRPMPWPSHWHCRPRRSQRLRGLWTAASMWDRG